MNSKIAITGALGTVGTVIRQQLDRSSPTLLDLHPDVSSKENGYQIDLSSNQERLRVLLQDHDTVIHLAWDLDENYNTSTAKYDNRQMFEQVYRAARDTDVNKVITASSIHAINMRKTFQESPYREIARGTESSSILDEDDMIGQEGYPPATLYGWSKRLMEYRGQAHAGDDLFVVCVRFGGVHPEDNSDYPGAHKPVNYYPSVYCSHNDCGRLITHILNVNPADYRNQFHLVHGISDNSRRIHTYKNSLDWQPEDDSEDTLQEYWDPCQEKEKK